MLFLGIRHLFVHFYSEQCVIMVSETQINSEILSKFTEGDDLATHVAQCYLAAFIKVQNERLSDMKHLD